jgi:hypothetical protein
MAGPITETGEAAGTTTHWIASRRPNLSTGVIDDHPGFLVSLPRF